ncbi:MAG: hypothetical protein KC431_31835, partial [Myxococcales bacterium]|nr:hypothetical protein [Myxococcales bacterium]
DGEDSPRIVGCRGDGRGDGRPLPTLQLQGAGNQLPDLREAWAWAHVQASVGETSLADDAALAAAYEAQPEAFVARLLCPRRLEPGRSYLAALVPSFEAGRLAGLGLPPPSADAPLLAWSAETDALELPVYHHFGFRCAAVAGDFETLVERLQPMPLAADTGTHALDIGEPGSDALLSVPGTTVDFRGALIAPDATPPHWPAKHRLPFQQRLRTLLDAGLSARPDADSGNADPEKKYQALVDDPLVAPPVYGALPTGVDAVPDPRRNNTTREQPPWLAELNLDPALRAVAGLGAEVVRTQQEQLMAEAWDQAAGLRELNALLTRTRLAREVGRRLQQRLRALPDGVVLQLSRGAHSRLAGEVGDDDGTRTLHGRILAGALPKGLVSAATRRRLHRRSPLARASLGKRGEASPSGALTGAFLSRSRQLLRFAKPTIPTGTVFADSASLSSIANLAKQGTNAKTSNQTVAQAKSISLVQPVGAKVLAGKLGALGTRAKGAPAPAPTPAELELRALANAARAGLDPDAILGARLQTLVRAPTGWARAQWQQATKASPVPARLQACPSFDAPLIDALIARDP